MSEYEEVAISVQHVNKTFKLPLGKANTIKGALVGMRKGKGGYEKQQVLRNISFEVKKGEFFGVVGRNGSGKSTLLKLLAGIYTPDSGLIDIKGTLTPFIELGVGFNPELTGRENIFLNGALLGFNRKEMGAMFDEIIDFAELHRFMDQKLKNYSSGMQVRLAFSIAINVNSDILLLDEVLAVGDAAFQKKCFDYFRQLKKNKKTVVFISHDMNAVREYCDRAILLENGKIVTSGNSEKTAEAYTKMFNRLASTTRNGADNSSRWGSGVAHVREIDISQTSKMVTITTTSTFNKDVENPIFGFTIKSPIGTKIIETNTKWARVKTGNVKSGQTVKVTLALPNIFTNGLNYITTAISDNSGLDFYDWWEDAAAFTVDKDEITTAATLPEHKIGVKVLV